MLGVKEQVVAIFPLNMYVDVIEDNVYVNRYVYRIGRTYNFLYDEVPWSYGLLVLQKKTVHRYSEYAQLNHELCRPDCCHRFGSIIRKRRLSWIRTRNMFSSDERRNHRIIELSVLSLTIPLNFLAL